MRHGAVGQRIVAGNVSTPLAGVASTPDELNVNGCGVPTTLPSMVVAPSQPAAVLVKK